MELEAQISIVVSSSDLLRISYGTLWEGDWILLDPLGSYPGAQIQHLKLLGLLTNSSHLGKIIPFSMISEGFYTDLCFNFFSKRICVLMWARRTIFFTICHFQMPSINNQLLSDGGVYSGKKDRSRCIRLHPYICRFHTKYKHSANKIMVICSQKTVKVCYLCHLISICFLCFYVKVGCMNIVTEVDICDARMQLTFLCASRCLHVEPVDM
jgi:hypothetical protein